jgi:hypothetical protein
MWVIVLALWCAPALFFVKRSVWIGPGCLLGILVLIGILMKGRPFFATFAPPKLKTSPGVVAVFVHGVILLGLYGLTYVWFYNFTDTWEVWTWLMHSSTQYGRTLQTEQEVEPTLFEVLHKPNIDRWHGPHITHGLLHSTPMVSVLKVFVNKETTRFTVNQIVRVLNIICALGGIPLFFMGLQRIKLIRHVEVAGVAALTSPGIFVVSAKGHWLGISYGVACLAFWVGILFLVTGKWRYLLGFVLTWGLLLGCYTSVQFFFIICGTLTVLYLVLSSRNVLPLWRIGVVIACAACVFYLLIGLQSPRTMIRHFQGNGESWFEIRKNQLELDRFAGYWQESASKYGLESTLAWPLFYRAGLGMINRNIENLLKNFLGTGRFYHLWLTPHHGEIKSFGFVLPWLLIIGSFLLISQHRWRESIWEITILPGTAVIIGVLLLVTWDMSAHRLFSINLLLAAFAGVLYDRVLGQCRPVKGIAMKYPLSIAFYGQLLVFLLIEKGLIGM